MLSTMSMLQAIPEARPGSLDNMLNAAVQMRYMVPADHAPDDLLRPAYWKNVTREAGQQRVPGKHAWNTIRALCDDGSWMIDLLIISVATDAVHVRELTRWDWRSTKAAPAGYTVEHVRDNGWRAIEPGGAVIAEKLTARDNAVGAAEAHAEKVRPVLQMPSKKKD